MPAKVDAVEYEMIIESLAKYKGNTTSAAKELGLTRRMLGLRMKKLGINCKKFKI
jgi:Nif-specific regulatory protein